MTLDSEKKSRKNLFEIQPGMLSNFACIKLKPDGATLVDPEDYKHLNQWKWYKRKSFNRYYAQRPIRTKTGTFWLKMHRQIMQTPPGYVVHHKNRRTMDNRKSNLENMTQKNHKLLHTTEFPGRCPILRKSPKNESTESPTIA